MNDEILTIECEVCQEERNGATSHDHEGLDICDDCWPTYAEENGLCESCGTELAPIYENNGFTPPEGPAHYDIVGYKPCYECSQTE